MPACAGLGVERDPPAAEESIVAPRAEWPSNSVRQLSGSSRNRYPSPGILELVVHTLSQSAVNSAANSLRESTRQGF